MHVRVRPTCHKATKCDGTIKDKPNGNMLGITRARVRVLALALANVPKTLMHFPQAKYDTSARTGGMVNI